MSTAKRLVFMAWLPLAAAALASLPGCERTQGGPEAGKDQKKAPSVVVSHPVPANVTDYEEFTGRVEAANRVGIQAMVTGYLVKINFVDSKEVKEGDVLFEIDPSVFQASFNMAKASWDQAKARFERLDKDYDRNLPLASAGTVSKEEFNKIQGDRLEAAAAVGVARSQFDQADVNLRYTKVRSAISGKVSRRLIDVGNMVKANETMLTWVYQIDPMYGYFDVDERTVIKLRKLINEGRMMSYHNGKIYVDVGLADEEGFSLSGYIDWVDNVLDAGSGTLKVRCVIHQPRVMRQPRNPLTFEPLVLVSPGMFVRVRLPIGAAHAAVLVSPGMFVRVRLPVGAEHPAVLIAEKAIGTDQGEKYVYVVNGGKVERRNVKLGQMHNGLRVVETEATAKAKGLRPSDLVVISGLQRVRPGDVVEATAPVPMPRPDLGTPLGANGNVLVSDASPKR